MSRSEKRRQARTQGGDSSMKKIYYLLGAVAIIGVAVVVWSVATSTLSGAATAPVEVEGLDDSERLVELAQGVTLGDENAPVTIVEFGDYQCPACQSFANNVKPQVQLQLVDRGLAKFVYYDFPLVQIHPHAFLAARAARCAGDQDRYWDYHDLLFRMQPRWSGQANAVGAFQEYASSVGLDTGEFRACLQSDRHAEVVTANMHLGAQLGVAGTPTVLVNAGSQVRRVDGNFASIQSAVEDLTVAPTGGN